MAYKILIVDDEAHYADMLRDLLLQNNFIADMVTSVQQALDAMDTDEYALIIADFKMPGMDGSEFLHRVRQRNAIIPFIMVSGLMNTHELIRVANLGVTVVFEKPLEITSFIETVKKYVSPISDSELQNRVRGEAGPDDYPADLSYISDKSPLGREFVHRLWHAQNTESYAIVPVRPGAEVELIAREIARWKGRPRAEFYTLTPDIIATSECVQALNAVVDETSIAPVLIINGIEEASDEHLFLLAEFLRGRHIAPAISKELFFLLLPNAAHPHYPLSKRNQLLGSIIKSKRISLPPLAERPADLAHYAMRLLHQFTPPSIDSHKAWFDDDAIALLLRHDWSGEYDELVGCMKKIAVSNPSRPLRAVELATLFHECAEIPPLDNNLARRLLLAQETALSIALANTGGDVLSALLAIGVSPEIAENTPPGELCYPELLK